MNKQPNILLITTDQQRSDTIHATGAKHMITPNLDRLAQEGCSCLNAYSPNPVCLPARHNIVTGLSARHHTFDDNYFDDSHQIPYQLPTFAQCLSDHGYDTIAIGKMHFQPYRRHNGFNKLKLMDEIPRFREDDEYAMYLKNNGYEHLQSIHGVRHLLYMQPQQSIVDEAHHGTTWVANEAIDYIQQRSFGRPFMMWAGFIAPHPPFDVPHEWADLYKGKTLPGPHISKTEISTLAKENINIGNYPNEGTLMRARELYYSAISHVDHHVGRILDALEKQGELDNTFVIFTSDHGEMLGDMGTFQKFLPYDGSSKIPMLMRYPSKIEAGTQMTKFTDLNDLFPTFLDLAGIEMPSHLDYPGKSLFDKTADREFQYIEHQHGARRWVSVRNQAYKYNYYYGGGKEELFDMINDPFETENLILTKASEVKEISQQMRQKSIELEFRYGLEDCIENNDFKKYDDFEINFYREANPPFFPKFLRNQKEKDKLLSLEEEIKLALRHEPTDLHLLDIDYFVEKGILNKNKL